MLWSGHCLEDCPISVDISAFVEQVDFVKNSMRSQGNPYSSTFNQGWRNHSNFSWRNQGHQKRAAPPRFSTTITARPSFRNEESVGQVYLPSDKRFQNVEATLLNHITSLHNLENQVG